MEILVYHEDICDAICKNLLYGGKNIVGPDQTQRVMRGVWSGPMIFGAHEHLQYSVQF